MKLNTFNAKRPETFEFELGDYMPVRSVKQAEEVLRNMSLCMGEDSIQFGTLQVCDDRCTVHHYVIERDGVTRTRTTYGADVYRELLESHARCFSL
jgi:hypothetical protein